MKNGESLGSILGDFILKKGKNLTAIEVKSSYKKEKLSGLDAFAKAYNPKLLLVIGQQGISLEDFLKKPIENWVK